MRSIFGSRWEISTKSDQDLARDGGAHPLGLLPSAKTIKFDPKDVQIMDFAGLTGGNYYLLIINPEHPPRTHGICMQARGVFPSKW